MLYRRNNNTTILSLFVPTSIYTDILKAFIQPCCFFCFCVSHVLEKLSTQRRTRLSVCTWHWTCSKYAKLHALAWTDTVALSRAAETADQSVPLLENSSNREKSCGPHEGQETQDVCVCVFQGCVS